MSLAAQVAHAPQTTPVIVHITQMSHKPSKRQIVDTSSTSVVFWWQTAGQISHQVSTVAEVVSRTRCSLVSTEAAVYDIFASIKSQATTILIDPAGYALHAV